jgi:starch phosphorylase
MEQGTLEAAAVHIREVSDATLWALRNTARQDLVRYAREQCARQRAIAAAPTAEVEQAQQVFDPQALTLGFARRFATYKRPGLLLHDPERLLRILTHPERPVQLIVAGKAHPQDHAGQALVQEWVRFSQRPEARRHVLFLSDYDMLLASHLVQGVDVWLNNPRRPWEASGTSGMKVLVNGGLNLSELDGWWAEAYAPEVGWALGDGQEHGDDPAWDAAEAAALFTLLEQEVIPAFYSRDANGIPTAWVARMRESMAQLTARFDANRTVREYTEQFYLPAAAAYRQRAADKGRLGAHILDWQRAVAQHWAAVYFGPLQVETAAEQHVFQLPVYVGELDPDTIRVELYADPEHGGAALRQVMTRGVPLAGATNGYMFSACVPACRPAAAYTPRLIPYHPEAAVPLEAAQILWQR